MLKPHVPCPTHLRWVPRHVGGSGRVEEIVADEVPEHAFLDGLLELLDFPRISGQVRTAVQSVQPSLHPRESGASAAQQRSRGLRPGDR